MSLGAVRPYFKDRLGGLGFSEWTDGFNFENIPETILDKAFHVLVESIAGGPINHTHQDTVASVVLRVFFRGYRDVSGAIDESILGVETIVKDVCKVSNRTSQVLNVVFDSADFEALNLSNDNSVLVTMRFSAEIVLGVEE